MPQSATETVAGVVRAKASLRGVVGGVLCNAMNYPNKVGLRVLGEDMGPLIDHVVDAVLAATTPTAHQITDEQAAAVVELRYDDGGTLFRRTVGPWVEVQS